MIYTRNSQIPIEELIRAIDREIEVRSLPRLSSHSVEEYPEGMPIRRSLVRHSQAALQHDLKMMMTGFPAMDDEVFVSKAYNLILRRNPDRGGLSHYCQQLKRGQSRISVLYHIRYSNEGRLVKSPVKGLKKMFYTERLSVVIKNFCKGIIRQDSANPRDDD
jgi:hypothetical protein